MLLIVGVAFIAELAVRTGGVERWANRLGTPLAFSAAPAPYDAAAWLALPRWARRRCGLVDAVMRHWPLDRTCLRRSLVVGNRLRTLQPVLRIGVCKTDGTFSAHAWVEAGGTALDPAASQFVALRSVLR